METIVIVTECKNLYGKYWEFKEKGTRQILAEVDRKKEKDVGPGPLYWVYAPKGGRMSEHGRHSKKDAAMEFAKSIIREQFAGVDIKFKMNVMVEHYKFA